MPEPSKQLVHNLNLKVVTPLFLGGSSQNEHAELRPPSIKGVMRFWHRATGPGALHSEASIYGSSSGQLSGQAPVLLQIESAMTRTDKPRGWSPEIQYLGYGVVGKDPSQSRPYIPPGTDLRLRLVFRPDASQSTRDAIFRSLRLMNYFGGLGSRSRRGFGSVVIENDMPADLDDLDARIRSELGALEMPSYDKVGYTMFSEKSRVLLVPGNGSWQSALSSVAGPMRTLRSAEHGEIEGYPWAKRDARMIGNYVSTGTIDAAPNRAAFGIPHNYFFKDTKTIVQVGSQMRRASPLMIHVHRLANGQHVDVVSFLPAPLLPPGGKIRVSTRGRLYQDVNPPASFSAVTDFLDYLVREGNAREVKLNHGAGR